MDDLIKGMVEKVGIDEATAMKVVDFLKEHADQLPALLSSSGIADSLPDGIKDSIPGGLGNMFGG